MAVANHPEINKNPPKGVMNQRCLAEINPVAMTKMDPEKSRIPAKNRKEIRFLDFSVK